MNPAAMARRAKEKYPDRYCPDPKCLWRIWTPWGPKEPCPKHMGAPARRNELNAHGFLSEPDEYRGGHP